MKKRYIIEIVMLIIALALPFINNNKEVTITTLKNITKKNIDVSVMKAKEPKEIRKTYKMLEQEYTGYFSYGSVSYMDVEEVTVFQQSNKEKREAILDKVTTHITNKLLAFKGYGTTQTKLLEESIVMEKGSYVICIVTDNKELKENIIECF